MKESFRTCVCKAITTIACAILMFAGVLGINTISAKAAVVRSYSVDLSNSRTLKFNAKEERDRGVLSQEYKDAMMTSLAMLCYDSSMFDEPPVDYTFKAVFSNHPYQAIYYKENSTYDVDMHALEGSEGIGRYVITKEALRRVYGDLEEAAIELYAIDQELNGYMDETVPTNIPEIIFNVEIKFSDFPVVTNYVYGSATIVSYEVGKEIEQGGIRYRITDAEGNLSAIGLTASSKTVTIPYFVPLSGFNFNVTDIAPGFMKGNKKTKQVIIGDNVTSIGSKAFYNCKKLKKVTIKSKNIKNIGTKAFGKNANGFTLKLPKGCKKAYKRLLKKAKIKLYKSGFFKSNK